MALEICKQKHSDLEAVTTDNIYFVLSLTAGYLKILST